MIEIPYVSLSYLELVVDFNRAGLQIKQKWKIGNKVCAIALFPRDLCIHVIVKDCPMEI